MFLTLLLVIFLTAAAASGLVALLFSRPLHRMLGRLVAEDLSGAWHRYLIFAIVVVGVGGGVRVGSLERYLEPAGTDQPPLVLNGDRWTLEIYQTVMGTLQSVAWLLLVFFVFALIAYVIVRGLDARVGRPPEKGSGVAT